MTRAVGLALLATGALAAGPLGPAAAPAAEFNGYLQEAISVRTGEGDVIFHRQTFNVKFEENASRRVMFRFEVDAWRDDPEFLDDRVRTRLREGYLRLRFPDFDLRLGRVQLAWGTAEGVIIGDQVSPFDIENFIVPGFDEIRLGVDGVFVDYYFSLEYRLQALWISHFQPPDFPNPASPWFPADLDELEAPGFNVELQPFTRPANTFENSEFGFRFSGNPTVADFAIGYLRSWDDRPTLHIRPGAEPATFLAVPEHDQFDLFTANVVYPIRGALLRADIAFERNRFLQLRPPDSPDPADPRLAEAFSDEFVARHDIVRSLVGIDLKPSFSWWQQADAAIQFVHEEVIDPHPFLAVADRTDLVSILLRAAYRNETVKPWLFAIADVRGSNAWVQAKVDYEPFDGWRLSLEYDWFGGHAFDGDDGGIFGMFDDNDMVKSSIRYSF